MSQSESDIIAEEFAEAAAHSLRPSSDHRWFTIGGETARLLIAMKTLMGFSENERRPIIDALLRHEMPTVQLFAAICGLGTAPDRSLPVLEAIAREDDFVGLVARLWTERWRSNRYDDVFQTILRGHPKSATTSSIRSIINGLSAQSLLKISAVLGRDVKYDDIVARRRLDDRVAVANVVCPFTIGANEASLSWVPDADPPTDAERLTWLWVICPDFGPSIREATTHPFFRNAIADYEALEN